MSAKQSAIQPELVQRAKAGDDQARQQLLDKSQGLIWNAIRKAYLGSIPSEEIEDLLQDIHLKILESLPTLKSPVTYPRWVSLLVKRYCWDLSKKKREEQVPEVISEEGEELSFEESEPFRSESHRRFEGHQESLEAMSVARLIAQHLSPEDYQLLYQYYGLEDSVEEILERGKIKKSAVYDRLDMVKLEAILAKATSEQRASNYDEAKALLRFILRHIGRTEKSKDRRFLYASGLTRLGAISQLQGEILGGNASLTLYSQAARVWEGLRDKANMLHAIHMMGLCYNILEEHDRAVTILQEVADQYQMRGVRKEALGHVWRDLGSMYLKVGAIRQAKAYVERSLPILEDSTSAGYRAALRKLGDVYCQQGRYDVALSHLTQSMHHVTSDQALLYMQGYVALTTLWIEMRQMGDALRTADEARRLAREHGFSHQLHILNQRLGRVGLL